MAPLTWFFGSAGFGFPRAFQGFGEAQGSLENREHCYVFVSVSCSFAGNDAGERQNAGWDILDFSQEANLPFRPERAEAVRLEDGVDLSAVGEFVEGAG